MIAERKLGTWRTLATVNASKTGSILMSFVALTYLWGFSALWYFIGAITGMILFIPFALRLKRHSRRRFYTLADYFKYNYGKKAAILASLVSIFLMFGLGVMNLIAGTKVFLFFTGWPFYVCAVIMVTIILIYLLLGGFRAVAKTDILQYIAMMFIFLILVFVMFKFSAIPSSEWNFFKADIGVIIGFFLVGILFPFASPELWQRTYSAKGKKSLRNGLLLSTLVYAFMAFLLALVALTVKTKFPLVDPDLALLYGFGNLLPSGLVGLASVLLFAAIMSSLDTYIFTGSSSIIQDFFNWDKKKTVRNIKKVIFFFAIVITLIAVLIKSLVISTYIFVAFYVVLAIPVMATWIRKSIKQTTLIFGFFTGIFGVLALLLYSFLIVGEVSPMFVIVSIGLSIFGLILGGIFSYFKDKY